MSGRFTAAASVYKFPTCWSIVAAKAAGLHLDKAVAGFLAIAHAFAVHDASQILSAEQLVQAACTAGLNQGQDDRLLGCAA